MEREERNRYGLTNEEQLRARVEEEWWRRLQHFLESLDTLSEHDALIMRDWGVECYQQARVHALEAGSRKMTSKELSGIHVEPEKHLPRKYDGHNKQRRLRRMRDTPPQ